MRTLHKPHTKVLKYEAAVYRERHDGLLCENPGADNGRQFVGQVGAPTCLGQHTPEVSKGQQEVRGLSKGQQVVRGLSKG